MTAWFDSLAALRGWAAAAQPVFICGQERSGTSALLLALARHPALFSVPDVCHCMAVKSSERPAYA